MLSSGHSQTAELIMPLLADPIIRVRQTAARQLGFVGDKAAVPQLIELIVTEQARSKPVPRRQTGFGSPGGQRDPRFDVFSMAPQSLGMLSTPRDDSSDNTVGRKRAGDTVFSLRTIDDTRLQGHVIMSLVQMQDERGVDELRKVMSGTNARLREQVMTRASFLAMFAEGGWGPRLTSPEVRAILLDHAQNAPNTRVRVYGAGALQGFSDNDTITSLVAMCDDEQDYLRTSALKYLLETTHSGRFEILKRFLSDKAPRCRQAAVRYYAELHSPDELPPDAPTVIESISLVSPLLSDDAEDVREATLESLGRLLTLKTNKRFEHTGTIRRMSTDGVSPRVRHRARRVLSLLSEQGAGN